MVARFHTAAVVVLACAAAPAYAADSDSAATCWLHAWTQSCCILTELAASTTYEIAKPFLAPIKAGASNMRIASVSDAAYDGLIGMSFEHAVQTFSEAPEKIWPPLTPVDHLTMNTVFDPNYGAYTEGGIFGAHSPLNNSGPNSEVGAAPVISSQEFSAFSQYWKDKGGVLSEWGPNGTFGANGSYAYSVILPSMPSGKLFQVGHLNSFAGPRSAFGGYGITGEDSAVGASGFHLNEHGLFEDHGRVVSSVDTERGSEALIPNPDAETLDQMSASGKLEPAFNTDEPDLKGSHDFHVTLKKGTNPLFQVIPESQNPGDRFGIEILTESGEPLLSSSGTAHVMNGVQFANVPNSVKVIVRVKYLGSPRGAVYPKHAYRITGIEPPAAKLPENIDGPHLTVVRSK